MAHYYVNDDAQEGGEHEVHTKECAWLPNNRTYLGLFDCCEDAIAEAKKRDYNADGCFWCSRDCHTR
ncbi:MAG: hypothetical protein OXD43_09210 [Bacteroidetes bacterium]|nr:hypothetical protein [Bacteroidota bacterium]